MQKLLLLALTTLFGAGQLCAVQKLTPQEQRRHHHSSCSSSSSSSSSSSKGCCKLPYAGLYKANLNSDGEFYPEDLESVLLPIAGCDPAAAAIIFDSNEPGSPNGITHPVGADYTKFHITKPGTYLIGWSFTIGCIVNGDGCFGAAFVQLYDAANEVALDPNPFQYIDTISFGPLQDSEVVSGQQIIRLEKGVELQLRFISFLNYSMPWIANPSFTITQIAD